MAFKPSTNFKNKTVLRTTYGREYEILGGPWGDNVAVWYVVRDLVDNLVRLETERQIEGWTVVNP
jgi:hypothetical protein